jgi:hypothetical protein
MPPRLFLLLFSAPLTACLQIGTGTGSMDAGGGSASPGSAAPEGGTGGINCFQDVATQTVLCEQVNGCPGVDVDPGAFPDCGFRLGTGSTLDLECLCGAALCPVGVATSCDQAQRLLAAQSALTVCQQQAEGRCVDLGAPDAGTGTGTCDKACEAECVGTPDCIQLCGC